MLYLFTKLRAPLDKFTGLQYLFLTLGISHDHAGYLDLEHAPGIHLGRLGIVYILRAYANYDS